MIKLKRVYEPPSSEDGVRILVERLWPRGLTKDAARIDFWVKELSPSPELRKWYGHDPNKWPEFRSRYEAELRKKQAELAQLQETVASAKTTFVFAARDEKRNSAIVLKDFLQSEFKNKE